MRKRKSRDAVRSSSLRQRWGNRLKFSSGQLLMPGS
ncbi:MAG: hypothetical protein JWN34_1576 [Bryobacterales bacterium]|nr:hypothetical protein [Bryobacterales bacterium]